MDFLATMRCFVTIARVGSFNGAARALHISPALTSKYLRQLEEHLGVQLIQRTTRALSLTEAGRACYARALPLLAEVEALEDCLRAEQASPRGQLTVSAPRALGEARVSQILTGFLAAYPGIGVELHLSDRFVDIVGEGFDLAIRIGALKDSRLVAQKLAPWPIVVAAAPAYLARHGTPARPEDLAAHECIRDSNLASGDAWPFVVDGTRRRVAVRGRAVVHSAAACRDMALAGLGVILTPRHVIADDLARGRLRQLLASFNGFDTAIYAVTPVRRHLPARTRALIDHLRQAFRPGSP